MHISQKTETFPVALKVRFKSFDSEKLLVSVLTDISIAWERSARKNS